MKIIKSTIVNQFEIENQVGGLLDTHLGTMSKKTKEPINYQAKEVREVKNPESEPYLCVCYYTGKFSEKKMKEHLKNKGYR